MEKVMTIIFGILSVILFTISLLHMYEKGFLINNAYIYASKEEREKMNKKPYYRQSGIVFMFLGIIFLLNAFNAELKTIGLFIAILVIVVIIIVYAIVSTRSIDKENNTIESESVLENVDDNNSIEI